MMKESGDIPEFVDMVLSKPITKSDLRVAMIEVCQTDTPIP